MHRYKIAAKSIQYEAVAKKKIIKKMPRYKIAAKSIQYEAIAKYWKMVILFCHAGLSD